MQVLLPVKMHQELWRGPTNVLLDWLNRLSAVWITRSQRLALAAVIIIDDVLDDGRYSEVSSEIKAGVVPHGSDEFIVSRLEHMMKITAGEWEKVFAENDTDEAAAGEI